MPPKAASETLPIRSQRETSSVVRELSVGGRGQQCWVHGFISNRSPVPSGVPQGSILGPLQFLVYVNDLPPVIQNRIALIARDSKCSSVIDSLQDCESLQKDLDSLHCWSDNWHLTVTPKRLPFRYDYKLNNNSLKRVTQVKDLGVTSRRTSHGTLTLTLS